MFAVFEYNYEINAHAVFYWVLGCADEWVIASRMQLMWPIERCLCSKCECLLSIDSINTGDSFNAINKINWKVFSVWCRLSAVGLINSNRSALRLAAGAFYATIFERDHQQTVFLGATLMASKRDWLLHRHFTKRNKVHKILNFHRQFPLKVSNNIFQHFVTIFLSI